VSGDPEAIVVGAGPNGLAAAIVLARAGLAVRVYEAADSPGGGTRSAELTLPGFVHDPCSAIHPTAIASPFFRSIDLTARGLEWVFPPAAVAQPLDGRRAAILDGSWERTAESLGRDADAWRTLFAPLAHDVEVLLPSLLGPIVRFPRHPFALARFGLPALLPATTLARLRFRDEPARALFGGIGAHSMLPLSAPFSAAFALALGLFAHAFGWPMARGGSGAIAEALVAELRALGGEVVTGRRIEQIKQLEPARAVVFDLTPRQVVAIAGDRLADRTRRRLERFRYGPGVFKIDWALDGPIPWSAPAASRAGTVHLGGPLLEVVASEDAVARGRHPDRPFALLAQQTLFDPSRTPAGKHTAWAYCHVPNGSNVDMTRQIEDQVERFAPGFRDLVLARTTRTASEMEAYDANYVGGDINGGLQDWRQLVFRPIPSLDPYHLGRGLYICSSSTPPGGGVHGMSGWHAARSALRREFGIRKPPETRVSPLAR
jgi:phytoene dehydrogenase-like protein